MLFTTLPRVNIPKIEKLELEANVRSWLPDKIDDRFRCTCIFHTLDDESVYV
jgi:hypothetical protein